MNGFVSFCDAAYVPLMRVLIDGLALFSKYPIEIFGINMEENPFIGGNVLFRSVKMDGHGFNRICYMKIYAALHTSLDYAVMLDADMIPNKNVDELIDFAVVNAKNYPLNAGHGRDPDNQADTMKRMGVKEKSMYYVHATFCFGKDSKPFWAEAQQYVDEFIKIGFWPPQADETIINCLLWKYGVKTRVSTFDPCVQMYEFYKKGIGYEQSPLAEYYRDKQLTYHIFHGCKDVDAAQKILLSIQLNPIRIESKLELVTE